VTSIRFPAEWESPAAIWLAWPHNRATWPGTPLRIGDKSVPRFDAIPPFFARWARLIAEDTPVRILAHRDVIKAAAPQPTAGDLGFPELRCPNIEVVEIKTNDCWVRDYGPTFIFESDSEATNAKSSTPCTTRVRAIDWRYNAWGGKYQPFDDDDAAAAQIARAAGLSIVHDDLCLEGGALETDGIGRLLTTTSCLVTPTRNPGLTQAEITARLQERLGVAEVVWLESGLAGDDTDGHIDQLARFIDPENIVVAASDSPEDANFEPLASLYQQLARWGASTQPRVNLHRLPLPPPRWIDDQRVPESYCNFLWLGRKRLLVPVFGHAKSDDFALGLLRELAVGTDVVAVDCRDLIWGLGALHCASRDQPAGNR